MSISFSASDFITLPQFAWAIYRACRDSANDFTELASEIQSLHVVLSELTDMLSRVEVGGDTIVRLNTVQNQCRNVLQSVECELFRYKSLGTDRRQFKDKVRWRLKKVGELRIRIVSHTTMLTLLLVILHR